MLQKGVSHNETLSLSCVCIRIITISVPNTTLLRIDTSVLGSRMDHYCTKTISTPKGDGWCGMVHSFGALASG